MTVTPQTNTTLAEIAKVLSGADDVVVCGHVSPDGDCIGSTLAVVHGLRSLGKRAFGVVADPVPHTLRFLPGADELAPAADFAGACVCFVAVDVPDLRRMGNGAAALHGKAPLTVRIDHHAVPERYSDYSYTDPDAVSTTSLVWEVLGLMGAQTAEAATCCYAGLMTDSGRFTFSNTDERAFRLAS
ncbi:MAG: DHH family phosphoesterase [Eggerthellaceae bacterium]|nr:DHH family phosphoesterase [Eggerthellaceae bacterium]